MSEIRVGVVVVSDKAAAGKRRDGCVDALKEALTAARASIVKSTIVPDEIEAIREAVVGLTDDEDLDVVVTAGGTGVGQRDVTPEALTPLIEKRVPGIEELIRAKGAEKTPTAVLSRSVAGTRGRSFLLALPGSPRGAAESLSVVWTAISHAVGILRGEIKECARN